MSASDFNGRHDRRLIGYDELEQMYGIKRGTAAAYVHRRLIPHIRLGPRHVKFDVEEIERWLEDRRVPVAVAK